MNDRDFTQQPVRLRYAASLLRPGPAVILMIVLIGLPLLAGAALPLAIALQVDDPAAVPRAMVERFRATLEEDPSLVFLLWVLPALAVAAAVAWRAQRRAWLRIGPEGIRGYLPRFTGFGLTGQTVGAWQVPRDRIRALRLQWPEKRGGASRFQRRFAKAQLIRACRVEIETDRETIRLSPFPWYRPEGPDHRLGLREFSILGNADTAAYIARSPVIEALGGLDRVSASAPEEAADPASLGFDLGRDPGMVLQLVLLFGAGLYALVDTFFLLQYTPLTSMPLAPFPLALIAALPLTLWLGRRAPRTERVAVAVLTVAALTAAVYPGLLRFNAATAEPRVVEYVPTAPGRFQSADGEYPAIDLSDRSLMEYWAQREPGASHAFTLLRGDAGFWQLDLAPLYERTRDFYAKRD